MTKYFDPIQPYEKMKRKFDNNEMFDGLVEICKVLSEYNDSGVVFKNFIPNKNQYPELGLSIPGDKWDQEKCDKATDLFIEAYTKTQPIFDSYLIEKTPLGNFIAVTTVNQLFSNHFGDYMFFSEMIIRNGIKNGVVMSGREWLEKFPFEYFSSFVNRKDALHWYVAAKIRAMSDEGFFGDKELDKLFVDAIQYGASTFSTIQLWQIRELKERKEQKETWDSFIRKWEPKGEFTVAYKLKETSGYNPPTEEEKKNLIEEFLKKYP